MHRLLKYKKITFEDAELLRKYYDDCKYKLCEYSLGTKLMWNEYLNAEWAEEAGCLIVRNTIKGVVTFDYPVAGKSGDEEAALKAMEEDCLEREIPLAISVVPEEKAALLLKRYSYLNVSKARTWSDYIYLAENLKEFAGRKFAKRRNNIKKFRLAYPQVSFRELDQEDKPAIKVFWERYLEEFSAHKGTFAEEEQKESEKMLELTGSGTAFRIGGMFDGDQLIALTLTEKCGDTLICHIEKALHCYEGVYPAFIQEYHRAFANDVNYVNREEDAADKGLRIAKMQYEPIELAVKYRFEIQNEIQVLVNEIPEIRTERLILSKITEEDIADYNALIMDRERNRWWGYDDTLNQGEIFDERRYFEVAEKNLEKYVEVDFAVRLNGRLIGEAVMYNFNGRAEAEIGCRIAEEYAGYGYGTEAFAAIAEWGLYKLKLAAVVSRCYKDNAGSKKMLASCMKEAGEDDTFYYFRKTI